MDIGGHGTKFYIFTASVGVVVAYFSGVAIYSCWSRRRQAALRRRYFGQDQADALQDASSTDDDSNHQGNNRMDTNEDRDQFHFSFEPLTWMSSTTDLSPGAAPSAIGVHVGSLPGPRMALPSAQGEPLAPASASGSPAVPAGVKALVSGEGALHMAHAVCSAPSQGAVSLLASATTVTSTPPAASASTTSSKLLGPDLMLASDMAYVSSAAYNPPPDKQGYQAQEVFGLPLVTLYDKDVLKKSYAGIIKVKLIEAKNLRRLWGRGEPRAFAVASVDGGSFRTHTADKTINPRWRSSQRLLVRNPELGALVVRVFNDDGSQPEDLGLTAVGLASLLRQKGVTKQFTLPLRGPAGDRACIKFECTLTLLEDADDVKLSKLKARRRTDKHAKKNTPGRDPPPESVQALEPVAFVDAVDTDTQVWVRWDKASRRLICAFRGTEKEKYKDILTDLRFVSCSFTTQMGDTEHGLKIHTGFMEAYSSVRRTLTNLLVSICSLDPGGPKWKVVLTGHSLGAALATLAAFELSTNKGHFPALASISLYTFGSPRVGNSKFASLVDKYVPDSWRMTNRFDIVTSIPPNCVWYMHACHPVRLKDGTTVIRYGPLRSQLKKNAATGKAAEEEGVKEVPSSNMATLTPAVFDEKAMKDVTALTAFFSFHGFSDHSCDLYARRLKEVKKAAVAATQVQQASGSATLRQVEAGVPSPSPPPPQEPAALLAVGGREAALEEDGLETPLLPYNS